VAPTITHRDGAKAYFDWIPACAGMTPVEMARCPLTVDVVGSSG
jgi:hypothetical protein